MQNSKKIKIIVVKKYPKERKKSYIVTQKKLTKRFLNIRHSFPQNREASDRANFRIFLMINPWFINFLKKIAKIALEIQIKIVYND